MQPSWAEEAAKSITNIIGPQLLKGSLNKNIDAMPWSTNAIS